MISKLDRNSDNAITLREFKEFLQSTKVQQREVLEEIRMELIQQESTRDVESQLSKTIVKMVQKLRESKIDAETIFNSYAAKETKVISHEKLKKLLRKIDEKLEFEDFGIWFKLFDQDNDGSVNLSDFQRTLEKY